jgi:hypothetical protein
VCPITLQCKWNLLCGDQHYSACEKRYSAVINTTVSVPSGKNLCRLVFAALTQRSSHHLKWLAKHLPLHKVYELNTELFSKFDELAKSLRRQLSAEAPTEPAEPRPQPWPMEPDPASYDDTDSELPTSSQVDQYSWSTLFKLANEIKLRMVLMTAVRDLPNIQIVMHFLRHCASLDNATRPTSRSPTDGRQRLTTINRGPMNSWTSALDF